MCFVTAEKGSNVGSQKKLIIHQIIESIAYEKKNNRARIMLDCWVENTSNENVSLYLIHPGKIHLEQGGSVANLLHYTGKSRDRKQEKCEYSQEEILYLIYKDRIKCSGEKNNGFSRRINCYRQEDSFTFMDNYFSDLQSPISTEVFGEGGDYHFTVLTVNNLSNGKTWFRIVVILDGESYRQYVKDPPHYWIEGPAKVTEFLQSTISSIEEKLFLESSIIQGAIFPEAYDIVVFRKGTEGVQSDIQCEAITSDVYRAYIKDIKADKRAYLFVSRSPKFWIDVCYKDDPRLTPIPELLDAKGVMP